MSSKKKPTGLIVVKPKIRVALCEWCGNPAPYVAMRGGKAFGQSCAQHLDILTERSISLTSVDESK